MKVGEFSLELINAETKEPLKEFTALDGKVYVEAAPDLEYFIRCARDRGGAPWKESDTVLSLEVDGKSLDYRKPFCTKIHDLGLWKRKKGVSTHQSLKFALKRQTRRGVGSSVGRVKATFDESIFCDDRVEAADHDKTNRLNRSSVSVPAIVSGEKKAFATVSGSTTASRSVKMNSKKCRPGKRLGELTIYYTSALGLSQLGILAPTDASDEEVDAPAASTSSSTRTNNTTGDGGAPTSDFRTSTKKS